MLDLNIAEVWKVFTSAKEEERKAIIAWLERVVSDAKKLLAIWETKAAELNDGVLTAEPYAAEMEDYLLRLSHLNMPYRIYLEKYYGFASTVLPDHIRDPICDALAQVLVARGNVITAIASIHREAPEPEEGRHRARKRLYEAVEKLTAGVAQLDVLTENFKAKVR